MRIAILVIKLPLLIAVMLGYMQMHNSISAHSKQLGKILDWKEQAKLAGLGAIPLAIIIIWMILPFFRRR